MNSTPATTRGRRRKLPPGWIPDQHGAWAMILVPAVSGVVLAGFHWIHVPLLLFWWIGYLCFQAGMLWLRSRKKPKYLPPVRVYGVAAVVFALPVAVFRPYLAIWLAAFLPLVSISVWQTMQRRDRSWLNDTVTVLAACLMLAVAFHANASHGDPRWTWVWLVFAVQFAYFWGTIPHVKALIRERANIRVARLSGTFHSFVTLVLLVLVTLGWFRESLWGGWFLVMVWVFLVARAYLMPWWQRRTKPLRPLVIGMVEIVFSVLIFVALLV